jgi:hypothetical protein
MVGWVRGDQLEQRFAVLGVGASAEARKSGEGWTWSRSLQSAEVGSRAARTLAQRMGTFGPLTLPRALPTVNSAS